MKMEEVMETLNVIFREIFDDDTLVIDEHTTADDIEDWDSLEQINLVLACQERFGLTFDISEVKQLKNVGDMAAMIERKLRK